MYDRIPYQVKQRAGDRGITAKDMEKSQHTDFKKNEETRLDAFEMKGLRRILRVSRTAKKLMSGFLTKLE